MLKLKLVKAEIRRDLIQTDDTAVTVQQDAKTAELVVR